MKDEPEVFSLDELPARLALSRRGFCKTTGVALVALGAPACFGSDGGGVGTGGIDDDAGVTPGTGGGSGDMAHSGGGGPVDMAHSGGGGPVDMAHPSGPVDLKMPVQSNCPGGVSSTGKPPSGFASGTATFYKNDSVYICHDSGGLYALSSSCTHAGCDVNFKSASTGFHCPCHGANFSYNGDVISGPNGGPLAHFALCIDGSGNVAYDLNNQVSSSTRL